MGRGAMEIGGRRKSLVWGGKEWEGKKKGQEEEGFHRWI